MGAGDNTPRCHANEAGLMKFVATQGHEYVRQTVDWLKAEYPGSVDRLLPKLRQLYREKRAAAKQ